jgi:hypothetical protein
MHAPQGKTGEKILPFIEYRYCGHERFFFSQVPPRTANRKRRLALLGAGERAYKLA